MNRETYEALRGIMLFVWEDMPSPQMRENYSKVMNWIDEVAKEYADCDCELADEGLHEPECR